MDAERIAFQGEVMLLNWAESSTRGRTVTLLLDEEGEAHPFRDFTIRQAKRAGQRFMAVLVQIDEHEQPVVQKRTASQRAAAMCKDEQFWVWATARQFEPVNSEETARQFMLQQLRISSRSEIDKSADVEERFEREIVVPFEAHKKFFSVNI